VSLEVRRGGGGVCPLTSPAGDRHVIYAHFTREDSAESIVGRIGMCRGNSPRRICTVVCSGPRTHTQPTAQSRDRLILFDVIIVHTRCSVRSV
jgi:hypothetical protein